MTRGWNNDKDAVIDLADADQLAGYARQFQPALSRYFARRGCQKATIEDLVQDVFVRLAKRTSGGEIENAEAYLMQTASSVWNDHLRKRQRRAHTDHVEYEEEIHGAVHFSPERVLEGRETIQRLVDALKALPARTRQVYVHCRIDGMRQKAVAERLGISVSAVQKHLTAASIHIGDLFGDEE